MKLIGKQTKSLLLLFMICYFHLICIANTTKRHSSRVFTKHTRRSKVEAARRKGRNHSVSLKTKIKSMRKLKKHKHLATQRSTALTKGIWKSVKNLIVKIFKAGLRLFKAAKEVVIKIAQPLYYVIKWVWEKTKTLLSKWERIEQAVMHVGLILNNPITYLFKQLYYRLSSSDDENVIGLVEDVNNYGTKSVKKSLGTIDEKGLTELKSVIKEEEVKDSDKHKNKINFVKGIYMGFMKTILNEINPVSLALLKTENLEKYLRNNGGVEEMTKENVRSVLSTMQSSVVDSTILTCSQQPDVVISITLFIETVMEMVEKYKLFFKNLINKLQKTPEEMKEEEVEGVAGQPKKLSVFQAIVTFTRDVKTAFYSLIKSFGKTFLICTQTFAEEIADYVMNKIKLHDILFGSLTYVTSFLDDAINTLPIWAQVRGFFDTFLSIFSVVKAPINLVASYVNDFKDGAVGLAVKIGGHLGNFVIRGVDAALALTNVQGIKTITKTVFAGFLLIYGVIKQKINRRFRFSEVSRFSRKKKNKHHSAKSKGIHKDHSLLNNSPAVGTTIRTILDQILDEKIVDAEAGPKTTEAKPEVVDQEFDLITNPVQSSVVDSPTSPVQRQDSSGSSVGSSPKSPIQRQESSGEIEEEGSEGHNGLTLREFNPHGNYDVMKTAVLDLGEEDLASMKGDYTSDFEEHTEGEKTIKELIDSHDFNRFYNNKNIKFGNDKVEIVLKEEILNADSIDIILDKVLLKSETKLTLAIDTEGSG